jgi:hypothetical protein
MCGISLDAYRSGLLTIRAYRSLIVYSVKDDQITPNETCGVYFLLSNGSQKNM